MTRERRFFLQVEVPRPGEVVELDSDDSRHLVRVLRAEIGMAVTVVASNREYLAEVHKISNKKVYVLINRELNSGTAQYIPISSIAFALGKGKKNDLMVEKVTEIGILNIIIWRAARSVPEAENSVRRLARWKSIAESASRQSGKSHIPEISFANDEQELMKQLSSIRKDQQISLCCSLSKEAIPLRELRPPSAEGVHLAVGPEGGLTGEEEETFVRNGYILAQLSPHVLRSETAAIVACGAAQALWGKFEAGE